ncbi:MAG TPA: 16S rRNA (uracil(1498)-N(3))-methyltransferase [Ktedonobacteraceae bacterium]
MHRFFVPPELLAPVIAGVMHRAPSEKTLDVVSEEAVLIALPDQLAHQVRDVLHMGVGEQLLLLDNSGDEFLAAIAKSGRTGVVAQVLERRRDKNESPVRVVLYQGLLKSARFEWILEKGTELGVSAFAPVHFRRSMAGLEEAGTAKLQRWQRIIQEAAEQCGRARLPELLPIRPLKRALDAISPGALAFIPWEQEHSKSLREALETSIVGLTLAVNPSPVVNPSHSVATQKTLSQTEKITVVLFIGPEGGLMSEEVALAQQYGVQVVTLGPRILRAETAALAAVANVMYALGG